MKRIITGGIVLLLIMFIGIIILFNIKNRRFERETKDRLEALKAGPTVKVAVASLVSNGKNLKYIGEAVPYECVTLYSKTSGYVEKILVDKGDKVVEGQLLASIISPETDQAYNAAVADLENKKTILKRDEELLKKEFISTEERDDAATAVSMAEASLRSLTEQKEYKNIKAPFTGTVTARFVDPGALAQNATNSQTSALPIVTVAQLNLLRTYVYVEQKYAQFIHIGYPVNIKLAENPQFNLKARVSRITGVLNSRTRMMTVEIDIDNKDNIITPGSYVDVNIQLPGQSRLIVSSDALVIKNDKYFIGTIDDKSCIRFHEIKIGENNGEVITVLSGISEGDKVGLNLGQSIADGQKVRIIE